MATRSIVTSQPDVACDVCERRLLRGEQPEVFLAAGERRTVCELCAPRAAHEGWLRETDGLSAPAPAPRTRRGRNLFGRLRQRARADDPAARAPDASPPSDGGPQPYDFLDELPAAAERSASAPVAEEGSEGEPLADEGEKLLERAVQEFNSSPYPRRLAGVARSLGAPAVSVRADEDLRNVVTIVVAWELCWYRYRIDLDEEAPEARLLAQGTELGELAREDRQANAVADEGGGLSLAAR